jgi:hypothetical protein
MNFYLNCTSNLGDFVNSLPVLAGLAKIEPINLVVQKNCRKFKGFREFLLFQEMFSSVRFDDEPMQHVYLPFSSWTREHRGNPMRPVETCRYENWVRDRYPQLPKWEVDDDFELKVPELPDVVVPPGYIAGDRWHHQTDTRRRENQISHLNGVSFMDFDLDLLTNSYIIKQTKFPFISCFTGISIIADLLKKPHYVVWKPEDFNEEFRRGPRNVLWDGRNIEGVYQKHYYGDRQGVLIHNDDLKGYLT